MRTIKTLDLADALLLSQLAIRSAQQLGVPMCVAVCDCSGLLLAFARMDGGKVTSIAIAQDKAFTAAAARQDTAFYASDPRSPGWRIHNTNGGRFSTLRGGVCIFDNETLVGAIGVSGGSGEQDVEVAGSAIEAFTAQRSRSD